MQVFLNEEVNAPDLSIRDVDRERLIRSNVLRLVVGKAVVLGKACFRLSE
jgi:hypothetical protein